MGINLTLPLSTVTNHLKLVVEKFKSGVDMSVKVASLESQVENT
jgi:hypothetical protein